MTTNSPKQNFTQTNCVQISGHNHTSPSGPFTATFYINVKVL